MSWLILIIAGCFEAGWLIGIEKSASFSKPVYVLLAAISMAVSLLLFTLSLKAIPIAMAYLVWLAVGVCAITAYNLFVLGMVLSSGQWFFLWLLVIGIVGLKLTS